MRRALRPATSTGSVLRETAMVSRVQSCQGEDGVSEARQASSQGQAGAGADAVPHRTRVSNQKARGATSVLLAEEAGPSGMMRKLCPRCKNSKPLSEYYPRRDRPGHVSPRCKSCDVARVKSAYHRNPEPYRAKARARVRKAWREKPEELRARAREAYATDARVRMRCNNYSRAYYQANKDRLAEIARNWAAANLERVRRAKKKYAQSERGVNLRAHTRHARRARLAGVLSTIHMDVRARILATALECAYCGEPGKLTLDHIYPIAKGGLDAPHNLTAACMSCNASKAAREPLRWAEAKHGKTGLERMWKAILAARGPETMR